MHNLSDEITKGRHGGHKNNNNLSDDLQEGRSICLLQLKR